MKDIRLKYAVDICLAISFLLTTITGIFKFPYFTDYFRDVFHVINARLMMQLHDWAGIAMALFVLGHLVLNWRWIVSVTKSYFNEARK